MLSRRQFLQAAGIALAAAHLPGLQSKLAHAAPNFEALYGRALESVRVVAAPETNSALVANLWSDTVVPILDTNGAWYRLPNGFARREGLQPMLTPAQRHDTPAPPPFWGEVSGATAVVRQWSAADAPLVTRIGHGGVLYVSDLMTLNGVGWYAVCADEAGNVLGWTQAAPWTPADVEHSTPTLTLKLDLQAQRLDVYDGAQPVLSAPVSAPTRLTHGRYGIAERLPSLNPQNGYYGVPWVLQPLGDFQITGAYWHNRFGAAGEGNTVEIMPALARWLYSRAAEVIVS